MEHGPLLAIEDGVPDRAAGAHGPEDGHVEAIADHDLPGGWLIEDGEEADDFGFGRLEFY